jgi:hypothetical protein
MLLRMGWVANRSCSCFQSSGAGEREQLATWGSQSTQSWPEVCECHYLGMKCSPTRRWPVHSQRALVISVRLSCLPHARSLKELSVFFSSRSFWGRHGYISPPESLSCSTSRGHAGSEKARGVWAWALRRDRDPRNLRWWWSQRIFLGAEIGCGCF